jgi:hypothetical protein
MLDEALTTRTTLSSAMTLAYRHYDVSTRTTPEFSSVIGLAPRGSVDEASVASTLAAPGGRLGLELRAGLARDSARQARAWRVGGALIWRRCRRHDLTLGYEDATEIVTALVGQRREGRVSIPCGSLDSWVGLGPSCGRARATPSGWRSCSASSRSWLGRAVSSSSRTRAGSRFSSWRRGTAAAGSSPA